MLLTLMRACPDVPSLVAMMLELPFLTALTNPLALTVATLVFDEDQAIARPVRTLLAASRRTAVACEVSPSCTELSDNETFTVETGAGAAVTVRVANPDLPSLVAIMFADPAMRVVTSPLPFTVATAVLDEDQATTRPVNVLLFASLSTAVACEVAPATTGAGDNPTATIATGAFTVSVD